MNKIRTIVSKPLFRFSSLNGMSVLIKIGIGLVTSKVLALFVGPSGFALLGNLRNFIATVETVSVLGYQNGTVKYVAEKSNNETALKKIISTVFFTLTGWAVLLSLILFLTASFFNKLVFAGSSNFLYVFKLLAVALPFYVANFVFVAILNGLGKFAKVVYVSILGNIIGFTITVGLVWQLKTDGALLAVVISPALLFIISCYYISSEIRFLRFLSVTAIDFGLLKDLSSYTLMALVSGVFGPLVFLAIRNDVIALLGIKPAGFWEAITRISTYYLMFITSMLSVYFLPKLALAKTPKKTKVIFMSYYRTVLPVFFMALVVLYFFRRVLVRMLFSADFQPVENLFLWQFIGDFFKAASLILGYQLLARKLTSVFIITEVVSMVTFYVLSYLFSRQYGIEGVVMAYALNYFIYLLILAVYFRSNLGLDFKSKP